MIQNNPSMSNPQTMAMLSRTASCFYPLLLLLLLLLNTQARGQFMRLEISVEEVFSISNYTKMDFGLLWPNSGWVELGIDDMGVGQVRISAEENIELKVVIEAPSELVLNENNTIPFILENAYLQDGNLNTRGGIPFQENSATFQLSRSGLLADKMDPRTHSLRAEVYFFGRVYAGNISPGIYSGTIGVRVEYN